MTFLRIRLDHCVHLVRVLFLVGYFDWWDFTIAIAARLVKQKERLEMSQDQLKPNQEEENKDLPSINVTKKQERGEGENVDKFAVSTGRLLEQADALVYIIVGFCFVVSALLALGYAFWTFGVSVNAIVNPPSPKGGELTQDSVKLLASTIISLVSDLLLVLIIMEVLSTVIQYLKAHVTSLTPFLAIGIISATRGILSIGARLSIGELNGSNDEFNRAMLELGVNAGAILALGITLTLLSRIDQDRSPNS